MMRNGMVVLGATGLGTGLGILAATPLPGFEVASTCLGACGLAAGAALGILVCVSRQPRLNSETEYRGH